MWQRFSNASRKVVFHSLEEATFFKTNLIDPELLLLGMFHAGDCIAMVILERYGLTYHFIKEKISESDQAGFDIDSIKFSPASKSNIELADRCRVVLEEELLTTGTILLGMLQLQSGLTAEIFSSSGITFEKILVEVKEFKGKET